MKITAFHSELILANNQKRISALNLKTVKVLRHQKDGGFFFFVHFLDVMTVDDAKNMKKWCQRSKMMTFS